MSEATRTQITYRYERWRALASGILETAGATFLLLIAVRWYEAGPLSKALVAAGGSAGLILAPWAVSRVEALRWPVSLAAARLAKQNPGNRLQQGRFPRPILPGNARQFEPGEIQNRRVLIRKKTG